MTQLLPNITFRLTKNKEQNDELFNKTIILYNDSIKNMISENNIKIINKYLYSWIDLITSYPNMYNESSFTEFFTKASFPDFVIIAALQVL